MTPEALDYLARQHDLGFRTLYIPVLPVSSPLPKAPVSAPAPVVVKTKTEAFSDNRLQELPALQEKYATCQACGLSKTRKRFVFGSGNPKAGLLFIGEAPGADEDEQGLPFVGAAGQLLTKMIENGMGLKRSDVYIANVLKCRPPGNREPQTVEIAACTQILSEQIRILAPEFICCLGRFSGRYILDLPETTSLKSMRGRVHTAFGAQTLVTYHPSALLQHPEWKKEAWSDLQHLMSLMGLVVPGRNK